MSEGERECVGKKRDNAGLSLSPPQMAFFSLSSPLPLTKQTPAKQPKHPWTLLHRRSETWPSRRQLMALAMRTDVRTAESLSPPPSPDSSPASAVGSLGPSFSSCSGNPCLCGVFFSLSPFSSVPVGGPLTSLSLGSLVPRRLQLCRPSSTPAIDHDFAHAARFWEILVFSAQTRPIRPKYRPIYGNYPLSVFSFSLSHTHTPHTDTPIHPHHPCTKIRSGDRKRLKLR